eukprot:CAMPEP_0202696010 /NCGR_PEP_ID=MMETSP1385-20130828/9404_1 /ASSEMBLY_ACC=CAM_ASM_000861 /TAXON_ID=933848 /ORGANISM="Elphidium margaritaceum" /LENGTH=200 /DNA_ID=CAMNT_0049352101 /DNA_START=36 /DNA_END=638 /DNA_ORIENTATION=-
MAEQTDEKKANNDEDVPDMTAGYKVADKKSMNEIMNADANDESLQKYKAQLLGSAAIIDDKDPRQVFFDTLVIEPEGRKPIELDPSKCKPDEVAFSLKEKTKYRVVIKFRVQREIVLGLKKFVVIKRKGIKVDKSTDMMGSFAPDAAKTYEIPFPYDVVPDGMLARGQYAVKTQFIDDDKKVHLEFAYSFRITKEWETAE